MIEYRPFRNNDAPLLAEIWRSQAGQRGLMQPMSAAIFESFVLCKPIFDRYGLILAIEDQRPLGFVHAGFGANAKENSLSTEAGVISMLMVRAPSETPELAVGLLDRGENYLVENGAKFILAGGMHPADPFYLGLYGGSQLSGILKSDVFATELFTTHGYLEKVRSVVLQRDLARFRPIVDRQQMQIRRRTSISVLADPLASSWWDACTYGVFERISFELRSRDSGTAVAQTTFWNMEPLATTWGIRAAGLVHLEVETLERRTGLATYLLGEAFRHLYAQGIAMVEVQIPQANAAARQLYTKLGFEEVDEVVVYRKELANPAT